MRKPALLVCGALGFFTLLKASGQTPTPSAAHPPGPSASGTRNPTPEEREATLRAQIFLDRSLFAPGKLDGLPGEFTTKATLAYQRAHQLEATGLAESLPIPKTAPLYTTYTLREEDRRFLGDSPTKPEDQSKKKSLPYTSFSEFVCERFHCSASLLAYLNPEMPLEKLKPGDAVRVPDVEPFAIEDIPVLTPLPESPEFCKRQVYVHRKERQLTLWDENAVLATFPITPGSETLPTPAGQWRLVAICLLPNFRWDEGVLNHGVRTEKFFLLPPGPNNPVGVAWCALSKAGIGIHGTHQPETIGRAASHGCMRLANWDAIRFARRVTPGLPVWIE